MPARLEGGGGWSSAPNRHDFFRLPAYSSRGPGVPGKHKSPWHLLGTSDVENFHRRVAPASDAPGQRAQMAPEETLSRWFFKVSGSMPCGGTLSTSVKTRPHHPPHLCKGKKGRVSKRRRHHPRVFSEPESGETYLSQAGSLFDPAPGERVVCARPASGLCGSRAARGSQQPKSAGRR